MSCADRSARFFSLLVCLTGVFSPALAQRSYDWKKAPPPLEVFAPVFEKIWTAATEPETFRSIKGDVLFDRPGWATTAIIPGAKESECWLRKDEINPKTPAYIRSPDDRQGHFECSLKLNGATDAAQACTALSRLLHASEHDWIVTPSTPTKSALSRVQFYKKGEFGKSADESMGPGFMRYIALTVFPNQCTFDIWARWVPDFLDPILSRVVNSGRYSIIQTPDISPSTSGIADAVAISVLNSSSFAADTWFVGPEIRGKLILPGSAWDLTISGGKYRVLTQFLVSKAQQDGGISASRLSPVYGTQDLVVGKQYKYRLEKPDILTDGFNSQITTSAGTSLASATPSPSSTVKEEIEKIRSSNHSQVPTAQSKTLVGAGSRTTMTVRNSTRFSLSVYFDGPVSSALNIPPNQSQSVDLAAGKFRVAGRVDASDVLPFYGEEIYGSSMQYSVTFYIGPQ